MYIAESRTDILSHIHLQVIAGLDGERDARQPRDLQVPDYVQLVGSYKGKGW